MLHNLFVTVFVSLLATSSLVDARPGLIFGVLIKTTSKTTTTSTTTTTSSKTTTTSSTTTTSFKTSTTISSSIATSSSTSSSASSSLISSSTATSYGAVSPISTPIRGVNIGGWLVAEAWMNSDLMGASGAADQWSFDQTTGAAAALQNHWSTYFNQSDVAKLASWGINTVRIPIGYWAYNNTGTPYITGADAYLEKAMTWLRAAGIKAIVCVHGSPGSQNGYDNSGHAGSVQWQLNGNLNTSTTILQTIAQKYGSSSYADVVYGIEIVNEQLNSAPLSTSVTQAWVQSTFNAMKSIATNPNLRIVASDGFSGASAWSSVEQALNGNNSNATSPFLLDLHLYQNQASSDNNLSLAQHISKACGWSTSAFVSNIPTIVGEYSAEINICSYPDGTIVPGKTCIIPGCQCAAALDVSEWGQALIDATRKYTEAQLDTFEMYSTGYFMWSYKAPGAWGMNNLFQYGVLGPNSITDRVYPKQCS